MAVPASRPLGVSRRGFMVGAAGLTFAFVGGAASRPVAAVRSFAVDPWVTISVDGTVTIMAPAVEMGQGSRTSLPLILAEELDADWSRVRVTPAPASDALYGNPGFGGMQYTAASMAVAGYYAPLRLFGAQVRRVLLANVAREWDVPIADLSTEPGTVVHAKSGRRIGYGDVARFAQTPVQAPKVSAADLKKPGEFRLIGRDVMRVDLPSKVDGSAQYSIDVRLPGMLYAAILRSPVEGDAPATVDDAKARLVPGVRHIVRLPYGVAVLGDDPGAVFAAKDALAATWTRAGKANGFDSETAVTAFAAAAGDRARAGAPWEQAGDARGELERSAATVEAEYRCDYAYHAQMEPLNAVASVAPDRSGVEIWCGTQAQTMAVAATAKALGLPAEKVVLHDMLLGGAFGRRGHRDEEFIVDAVLLSDAVKRPVKVIWTREDDLRNGRFRPMSVHAMRAGLDDAGRVRAWSHRVACDPVTAFQDPVRYQRLGKDFIAMMGSELKSYDIPHRLSEQVVQDTGMRTSALRAIGFGPNKFATEAFLDEIAVKRGVDPLALRLDLLKANPRARAVLEAVARSADWGRPRPGRGLGLAFVDYAGTQLAGVAEVSVARETGEIRVHRFWAAIDPGVAVQPDNVAAQTEGSIVYGLSLALFERITVVDGAVQETNFHDYPVMRLRDVPEIHVEVASTPNAPTGAGQMATPLVAPAVSNAVAALTGARLRRTPMTPDRVLEALRA